jgi:hypothetical protein
MHINYLCVTVWTKYGTNLKKSSDKHEANSVYVIRPQSLHELYSITARMEKKKYMDETEITAKME